MRALLLTAFWIALCATGARAGPTAWVSNKDSGSGDSVDIIVCVAGLSDATAFAVTVGFDPRLYEVTKAARAGNSLFFKGLFATVPGEVGSEVVVAHCVKELVGASPEPGATEGMKGSGPVATITFRRKRKDAAPGEFLVSGLAILDRWREKMVFTDLRIGSPGTGSAIREFFLAPEDPSSSLAGTKVKFGVPKTSGVRVTIHDILGREVRLLLRGTLPPGLHTAEWDGKDSTGREVGPGVYFLRATVVNTWLTRNSVLLR